MQLTLGRVYLGVLIPFFNATGPRARSLRLVRIPSDQNTR
jgi:hypothetical protein